MSKDLTNPAAPAANPLAALLSDPDRLRDFPIETVERMFAMDREIRKDAAREQFAAAMNRVQASILPVKKHGTNDHTRSKFALLEHIQSMLDPILIDNGLTYSFSAGSSPEPGYILVKMTLRHIGGHEEAHELPAPIDDKGPQGKAVKTALHGMGSTMTYCERILLTKVFGVQTFKDDDGNAGAGVGPGAEPIDAEQVANLEAMLDETKADRARFLRFFGVDNVDAMVVSRYREAMTMLEAKRRQS